MAKKWDFFESFDTKMKLGTFQVENCLMNYKFLGCTRSLIELKTWFKFTK